MSKHQIHFASGLDPQRTQLGASPVTRPFASGGPPAPITSPFQNIFTYFKSNWLPGIDCIEP